MLAIRTGRLLIATWIGTCLMALLFASSCAFAQEAVQKVEQQMSPEQFKSAGLDKLSAAELANLNAWLNRKLDVETSKAAASAKEKVEHENRGFGTFGKADPIVAKISGEFRGFGKGRIWTLDNGQVWQQLDEASLAGVKLSNPSVKITPSVVGNAWYLSVGTYNSRAKVQRVK